jgi:hypothetical protein
LPAALANAFAVGELLFFAGPKKSNQKTAVELLDHHVSSPAALNASAVGGSLFFASAQRKVTKRKGASPIRANFGLAGHSTIFGLAIHGSTENGAHPWAPPYGLSDKSVRYAFLASTANATHWP